MESLHSKYRYHLTIPTTILVQYLDMLVFHRLFRTTSARHKKDFVIDLELFLHLIRLYIL